MPEGPGLGALKQPIRNLVYVVSFVAGVIVLATAGYMAAGWSFEDAVYMVILTVFTVGYEEVRRVDTPALHLLTIATIVLGCTGMIVLTGALVQVFTVAQLEQFFGRNRVKSEIDRLDGHVIVCGFGRIGRMLAKDLSAGRQAFVVLERSEARVSEIEGMGHLALAGDATQESALRAAGIDRAKVLATVLPDDAANVFITLTARSLNPDVRIIARGEAVSTESKLIYAGADTVVLPTYIGAERIAELILYPKGAGEMRGGARMQDVEQTLRGFGVRLELMTAGGSANGMRVADLEQRAREPLIVLQIDRVGAEPIIRPDAGVEIRNGDGLLMLTRASPEALVQLLQGAPERVRAGRSLF